MVSADAGRARALVECMIDTQRHRGPDGTGWFAEGGVILAHRRLAIVDLSGTGAQPMRSNDGRWTIVFNGEIFNHRDLRRELPGPFRGTSDTEVLLEACARWGVTHALDQAAGMFAFALWDSVERELILARDRYGEKPLVYFWDRKDFAFGSELKALYGLHERRLDAPAVAAYLALGYVPAPLAIFRNCHKLPAGYLLRFKAGGVKGGTEPQVRRWFHAGITASSTSITGGTRNLPDLLGTSGESKALARVAEFPPAPAGSLTAHEKRLADGVPRLRMQVARAVEERLRADVPVALALSGGVDSSVIAAECVRQGARPSAFVVRFGGSGKHLADQSSAGQSWSGQGDLPYAQAVAQHLGLKLAVLDAAGLEAGLPEAVESLVQSYDEPFADSSAVACLALARALAGRYKVILNGDGGDEVFGGYRRYERIAAKQWIKRGAAALGLLDGEGAAGVYVQSRALFPSRERRALLNGNGNGNGHGNVQRDAAATLDALLRQLHPPFREALPRALWIDRSLELANGLTHKMDIALGSQGIEGRSPFLDHRLVEWASALPQDLLVRGREKKVLLRAAYAGELPRHVLDRPKQGFGAPIGPWLSGPLREWARAMVPSPLLTPRAQQNKSGQQLWALAEFSQWARHWKATW